VTGFIFQDNRFQPRPTRPAQTGAHLKLYDVAPLRLNHGSDVRELLPELELCSMSLRMNCYAVISIGDPKWILSISRNMFLMPTLGETQSVRYASMKGSQMVLT
jgi:hypothetical protein